MDTFGKRLKSALNLRDMKAAELSRITRISKGAISDYLKGRYNPKQKAVYAIANALDVNAEWLMGCGEAK